MGYQFRSRELVLLLCRYEVTNKGESLQEIYLEEEKSPPE
jgi:hypothetical protein